MNVSRTIVRARVIPWSTNMWGVTVDYEDGNHRTFEVGGREAADGVVALVLHKLG
jgi:hypothetical protein